MMKSAAVLEAVTAQVSQLSQKRQEGQGVSAGVISGLEAAHDVLKGLTKGDLSELGRMRHPPAGTKRVLSNTPARACGAHECLF